MVNHDPRFLLLGVYHRIESRIAVDVQRLHGVPCSVVIAGNECEVVPPDYFPTTSLVLSSLASSIKRSEKVGIFGALADSHNSDSSSAGKSSMRICASSAARLKSVSP